MIHLGDITKISGYTVPPVNVVIGGSPCQDLSVAGGRAGLEGKRSGLFMEQIRIIKEMRNQDVRRGRTDKSIRPRYMVWENVPGAFSSNRGEDFRIVLEETARVVDKTAAIPRPTKGKWTNSGTVMGNGWSIAWRVLDAQFWGVPQRRRRIALVTDFGGESAPEILFERESVCGDSVEGGAQRQEVAPDSENGVGTADRQSGSVSAFTLKIRSGCEGGGKGALVQVDKSATPSTHNDQTLFIVYDARGNGDGNICPTLTGNHENRVSDYSAIVCMATQQGGAEIRTDNKAPTLTAAAGMSGNNQPVICIQGNCIDRADTAGCNGKGWTEDGCYTLNTVDRPAFAYGFGTIDADMYNGVLSGDIAVTLTASTGKGATNSGPAVICIDRAAFNQGKNAKYNFEISDSGVNSTIVSRSPSVVAYAIGNGQANNTGIYNKVGALNCMHDQQIVMYSDKEHGQSAIKWIVRRLTPLECERLQGFPDGWTDIGDWTDGKGKKHKAADSARYKALGNSIAIPPWTWILHRLGVACGADKSMASLFDGIGGFPLIWERLNGAGSCSWSSEIDEFCIAVTKLRFGE